MFLINRLIGLYGGLTVALRIVAPWIVRVGLYVSLRIHVKYESIVSSDTSKQNDDGNRSAPADCAARSTTGKV